MTNSRAKGAHGEREAAKYLRKLGFEAERNGRNGYSSDDLIVPGLPNVRIEVKFGYPSSKIDIGTKGLRDAWEQADGWCADRVYKNGDKGVPITKIPVVLWKPPRRPWRLTWLDTCGLVTTTGDGEIKTKLLELNA